MKAAIITICVLMVTLVAGCVQNLHVQEANAPVLTVNDQEYADTVIIERVFLNESGWVVVRSGSDTGTVIGHAGISRGDNRNISIHIDLSSAVPELFAVLHYDRQNIGVYEFPGPDIPVTFRDSTVAVQFQLLSIQGLPDGTQGSGVLNDSTGKPANETRNSGGGGGGGSTVTQEPGPPTVSMTPLGFSPQAILINVNSTVRWVNSGGGVHWPASDKHPTHTVYPGSNITKCGTVEESRIFDACRGLAPGEIYEFVFNETGIWTYHDHLNPLLIGTVVVQ